MAPRKDARPGASEASPDIEGVLPFFRSKLRVPHPPDHSLRRGRLEELLDDLTHLPVTLIMAPAGSGKTALAASWAQSTEVSTAWVTLDETDADPMTLWTLLVTALDQIDPGCRARVLPLLRGGRLHSAIQALEEFLDDLDGEPRVLVIDNLRHLMSDEETSRSFRLFVEHLPAQLRLLLLSRHPPDLPVEAMRGNGQLAELGFDELRFSVIESAAVLRRLSPRMSQQSVATLARRADGWAAALQLSALAARSERAVRDVGDRLPKAEQLIDAYVWSEVLRSEPAEVVQTLVDTSAVTRVNASLAEVMTGRPDAGELLAEAERRCLFLTRLPGGWFQVHDLVRDMLLGELSKHPDGRLGEQHARAARWFEDVGESTTAVEHWLRAERPGEALRLLAASVTDLYDAGQQAAIIRLMQRIPSTVAGRDLPSLQSLALCQLLLSREGFLDTVAALDAFERAAPDVPPVLRGRSKILQSMACLMVGEWQQGEVLAREALEHLGPAAMLDPFGRFTWNLVARSIALGERWDDHSPEVLQTKVGLSIDPQRRLAWEGTRALGLALAGSPVDALRVAAGVARASAPGNLTILRAEVDLAEGIALCELGDRPRGPLELADLADRGALPVSYIQVLAALGTVENLVGEGALEAARTELARAESLVLALVPGSAGLSALGRVGTLVALADGELERAEVWSQRVSDPFWGPVSVARVRLAREDHAGVRAALVDAAPRCTRHEVVKGLLLGAAAESQEVAQKKVAEAIERASEAGMLETVAAGGFEVRELIERVAWRVPQEWLERLRHRSSTMAGDRPRAQAATEELTARELDVLRLLPSRLTLREIAQELYVSQNTLKFHLRLIYRKLGVNSRGDAVAVTRSRRRGS